MLGEPGYASAPLPEIIKEVNELLTEALLPPLFLLKWRGPYYVDSEEAEGLPLPLSDPTPSIDEETSAV